MSAHRARKRFGQNFLRDESVIERMVRVIDPRPGQLIVEIGPGLAALTRPLLEKAQRLIAVELDRDLVAQLPRHCAGAGELVMHQGDALRFDFSALRQDERRLRVVGNLPYNISTPLIFHLLESASDIEDMHFTLQKEVVDRLAAQPGEAAYGRLSVMVQYYCQVDALFRIAPGAFTPVPKVDSAFVRLRPHPAPPYPLEDPTRLSQLLAQAFGQRRKTLRNSLKNLLDEAAIAAAGVDPAIRPEDVPLSGFVALTRALKAAGDNPVTTRP